MATPTPEQIITAGLRHWIPFRFASKPWAERVARNLVHTLDRYGWLRTRPQPHRPTRSLEDA